MLLARSAPECHLYMDLHPCRCGEADFSPDHWLEQDGADLVARYQGSCRGCGTARDFSFVLDPELPPPPPAYGGGQPSQLIDPGQFLWVSEQFAQSVPADPAELSDPEQREESAEALETAIAALEEVLKFIPAGAEAVPEEAFTAPEGWMVYQQEPGRFRRDRLEAVLGAYRENLATYTA
ncbi:MAG: hypothetical protein ACRDT4_23430 [Micromonosporaceae bacterium]